MELKICPKCKRPYLKDKGVCPTCPEPYTWNQESYWNLGCLLMMILPLVFLLFFWLFLFLGVAFR